MTSTVKGLSGRPYLETIRTHAKKLKLFYGENDSWAPPEFCHQLKKEVPELDADINYLGIGHSFDFYSYKEMATLVGQWINRELNGL